MRTIDKIIIHSAATPEGKAFTIKDINRWHKERGFAMIGYHFVIYLDGSVHEGRPLAMQGAHTLGTTPRPLASATLAAWQKTEKRPKILVHQLKKRLSQHL